MYGEEALRVCVCASHHLQMYVVSISIFLPGFIPGVPASDDVIIKSRYLHLPVYDVTFLGFDVSFFFFLILVFILHSQWAAGF